MSDKSYVTMEQHLCVVCAQPYDTGALLLDRRLREKFDRHTLTGWGMCPDHAALKADGYVALVGCIEEKSTVRNNRIQPEDAYRTGVIAHLREHIFADVFDIDVPEGGVCFVQPEVIEMIQQMTEQNDD